MRRPRQTVCAILVALSSLSASNATALPNLSPNNRRQLIVPTVQDSQVSPAYLAYTEPITASGEGDLIYAANNDSQIVYIKRNDPDQWPKPWASLNVTCNGEVNNTRFHQTQSYYTKKGGSNCPMQFGGNATSFHKTVEEFDFGLFDLDPNVVPFITFGNAGGRGFDPQEYGIQPLSVVAVQVDQEVHYGVWADINAGNRVGAASLAMARLLFGDSVTPSTRHTTHDVIYIAFGGEDAVPGRNGAAWNATSAEEFEQSIKELGQQLYGRIKKPGKPCRPCFF